MRDRLGKMHPRLAGWVGAIASILLVVPACSSLSYYGQAVSGHLEVMSKSRDVDDLVAAEETAEPLRMRLGDLASIRDFAVSDLALPDNGSYRSYADLERPYLVWNVFAAPELSLEAKEWCYLVVGCVRYRGYFDRAEAEQLAQALSAEGYETWTGGVPAYSTLGWFDDPVLNTFVHWSRGRLAELIFHELAHQQLYIDDDTDFNESFATVVGQIGADRWLAIFGAEAERTAYRTSRARRLAFVDLMDATREKLDQVYDSRHSVAEKRARKEIVLADARAAYTTWKGQWGGDGSYDRVVAGGPNNAWFVALSAYHRWVPAFRQLFLISGESFERFYAEVAILGELDKAERDKRLATLVADQSLRAALR
jgi:predicted aminopeptidase